jgi:transposase
MNIHKNARTTPYSRLLMARRVGAGKSVVKVASDFCVSEQTVRKWVRRWQNGGPIALLDRSSRPARLRGTPAERIAEIERLRRQRMSSPAIARRLDLPISTVIKILQRLGPQSPQDARSAGASGALRAGTAGRARPYGHKEARAYRGHRPSHHRPPHRRD